MTFQDMRPIVRRLEVRPAKRFADSNRENMLAALAAAGMNVSVVTAAVPDEVLAEMLRLAGPSAGIAPGTHDVVGRLARAGVTVADPSSLSPAALQSLLDTVLKGKADAADQAAAAFRAGDVSGGADVQTFRDRGRSGAMTQAEKDKMLALTPAGRAALAARKAGAAATFADKPAVPEWKRKMLAATPVGRAALDRLKKK